MRVLFWFRSDLRLADNTGLHEAVRDAAGDVVPFFADEGPAPVAARAGGSAGASTPRARFVMESLADLARAIERAGSRLGLDRGPAAETVPRAARAAGADAVYWNDEYEPALARRDDEVERVLRHSGTRVRRFHDRLLVPPGLALRRDGKPFVVFTPFCRACEALPLASPLPAVTRLALHALAGVAPAGAPAPERGAPPSPWPGGATAAKRRLRRFLERGLERYAAWRDFPAAGATSRLSADLATGTISPRTVTSALLAARRATPGISVCVAKYVAELRWRDFYAHVLYHFPHCERGAFRREYDAIRWPGDPAHLDAWREGRTGYPMVDAAMRELATTGFMHNRPRMIVASFLAKDLLLDWRLGERHFMRRLVDADLASNNGGWQWAAGTGTDAQPYFRVFNPVLQGERFDPEGEFVRRHVPELARMPSRWLHRPWEADPATLAQAGVALGRTYPTRIVEHSERRTLAIEVYGAAARSSGK